MKQLPRTLVAIRADIQKAEDELLDLGSTHKHCPEIAELEKKLNSMRSAYQHRIEPKTKALRERIASLRNELTQRKVEGQLVLSPTLAAWFNDYGKGVDFGYGKLRVSWVSPDEKYVIISNPGGTAGQGTAMGSGGYYYAKACHWVAIVEHGRYLGGNGSNLDVKGSNAYLQFKGRLTKDIKALMIARIEALGLFGKTELPRTLETPTKSLEM